MDANHAASAVTNAARTVAAAAANTAAAVHEVKAIRTVPTDPK